MATRLIFTFLLFAPILVNAQEFNFFSFPNYDSTYVNVDWDRWSIRAFGIRKPQPVFLDLNRGNTKIKYEPNNLISAGLGIAYKFILLDIGFRLPFEKENPTRIFDLQTYLSLNAIELEAFAHIYRGFKLVDKKRNTADFRDDFKSSVFGFNLNFNVNSKVLSRQSIVSGTHTQKISTRSLSIGGYAFYLRISADISIVPLESYPNLIDESYIINTRIFTPGLSVGYGSFIVLPKNFYLYTGVLPGIGLAFGAVEANDSYQPPLGFSGKVNLRLALGYSSSRLYALFSFFGDYSFINLGNQNNLRYNHGRAKIIFGWRLYKSIKELEKINEAIEKF